MNHYQHLTGRRVVALPGVTSRRMSADFPGWGNLDLTDEALVARYLLPIPAGLTGTVVDVESHSYPPYTRLCVRFDDGSHTAGMDPAQFEFRNGSAS